MYKKIMTVGGAGILVLALGVAITLAGASTDRSMPNGGMEIGRQPFKVPPHNSELTPEEQLGKELFFAKISQPAAQSCASCHAPKAGWTGAIPAINRGGAVYAGADVGLTWSFLDGLHPHGTEERAP